MVLSQEDCRANEDHPMRKPMPGDRIVFMKQFTNDEELKSLDFFGTVKQNTDKLDLCGEHVLVLMLDPMHTMWNEIDRCDNYFALRISSTRNCDEVHPQCEVIRNGWTGGDMRVVRRGTDPHTAEPTVSVFENDGSAWKEIHNKTQDTAGNLGFGRLSLLQNFIDLHIAANPSVCEKNFTEMVQVMEGSAETEADSKDTLESLPDNFIIAQQQMEKLQNGGNKENVKAVLQGVLSSLNTESSGFLSRLKEKIVKQAVKRGISEADGSLNGTGRDICNRLPEELDRLRWIHDKPTDATNETVISVAGELAEAVISNPEFPCLEKMLKRFIRYAKDAETNGYPDTTFLFSEDDVNEEDDLYHCARPNKCIQKIRRVCETKHTADWEDITVSREEICKLHVMKATARSQHKSLGMEDLHEKLKEDEAKEGRHCTRDPLKPRRDPTLFWKTMTDAESGNTFVLKGVLNSDATKMAWMKVAVCSCCGGDDSTESMTEETKDFTKKRRRK
ncbi:uncharacterized protein LOC123525832 [Mercenaria mercenaria]|uniref:uncharacterized protein LOC123525832 n=1 Tax=Mercenaria mercenaria TaxID=6596 RepID=UPI00234EAA8B|nr:uncharacterized protein LOC123525832 [Mercenaria mercenaria]